MSLTSATEALLEVAKHLHVRALSLYHLAYTGDVDGLRAAMAELDLAPVENAAAEVERVLDGREVEVEEPVTVEPAGTNVIIRGVWGPLDVAALERHVDGLRSGDEEPS